MALLTMSAPHAVGQEVGIKGAITRSHFDVEGTTPFSEPLIATSLGFHVRFPLGPIAFQPELHVLTRGGTVDEGQPTSPEFEKEQLRLEYLEIPLLIALPVRFGEFEASVLAGPMVAVESRCRYVFTTQDVKTNVGCDPPSVPLFHRRALDYGVIAGASLGRRIGSGRVTLEARHTWGMNDIEEDSDAVSLRNRTFSVLLGYVISWTGNDLNQ